jgi:hypothetical protein
VVAALREPAVNDTGVMCGGVARRVYAFLKNYANLSGARKKKVRSGMFMCRGGSVSSPHVWRDTNGIILLGISFSYFGRN